MPSDRLSSLVIGSSAYMAGGLSIWRRIPYLVYGHGGWGYWHGGWALYIYNRYIAALAAWAWAITNGLGLGPLFLFPYPGQYRLSVRVIIHACNPTPLGPYS